MTEPALYTEKTMRQFLSKSVTCIKGAVLTAVLCLSHAHAADDTGNGITIYMQPSEQLSSYAAPGYLVDPILTEEAASAYRLGQAVDLEMNLSTQQDAYRSFSELNSTAVWNFWNTLSLKAGVAVSSMLDSENATALCASGNCLSPVDDKPVLNSYLIGARWQPSERFTVDLDVMNQPVSGLDRYQHLVPMGLAPQSISSLGTQSEMLDLSLSCEIGTGNWGAWRLGLQVSNFDDPSLALFNPAYANHIDSASVGLGWQYGSFSTDIIGRYSAAPAQYEQSAALNSLDINFSWQTPWNGQLMFGASNVGNESIENDVIGQQLQEQNYGRIPYIRYRQDL